MDRLREIARWLWRLVTQVGLVDVLIVGGLACVVYGLARLFPPGAWLFAGAAMTATGVAIANAQRKGRSQ